MLPNIIDQEVISNETGDPMNTSECSLNLWGKNHEAITVHLMWLVSFDADGAGRCLCPNGLGKPRWLDRSPDICWYACHPSDLQVPILGVQSGTMVLREIAENNFYREGTK